MQMNSGKMCNKPEARAKGIQGDALAKALRSRFRLVTRDPAKSDRKSEAPNQPIMRSQEGRPPGEPREGGLSRSFALPQRIERGRAGYDNLSRELSADLFGLGSVSGEGFRDDLLRKRVEVFPKRLIQGGELGPELVDEGRRDSDHDRVPALS